jgi:hypothetical protein
MKKLGGAEEGRRKIRKMRVRKRKIISTARRMEEI